MSSYSPPFSRKWDAPLRPWNTTKDGEKVWCYEIEMPGCCRRGTYTGCTFECGECGQFWHRGKNGRESIGGIN